MQVYPAASLINFAKDTAHTYFVDPNPSISERSQLTIYPEKASTGIAKVVKHIQSNAVS